MRRGLPDWLSWSALTALVAEVKHRVRSPASRHYGFITLTGECPGEQHDSLVSPVDVELAWQAKIDTPKQWNRPRCEILSLRQVGGVAPRGFAWAA